MPARTTPSEPRKLLIESPPPGRRPGRISRRLVTLLTAVLVSLVGVVVYPASAATAADPEGGTAAMRRQLDEAQRGYLDAKATVETSKARQVQLTADLAAIQDRLAVETAAVGEMAAAAYQSSGFSAVSGVLSTGSSEGFLDGITLLSAVATHETNMVRKLLTTRDEANAAKAAIDAEIGAQQDALAKMEANKQQAEQALWAVGGGQATGGFTAASSVVAAPAARNANGTWSPESRSVYEPASGGYITPRTAHAKAQAQAAGFTGHVTCYRPVEDGGEHPRGRACDFAVGSGGAAYGADRTYGNSLAAFFLFNAERLGVLYIIWYRQIWLVSSGWRTYYGCCGASPEHTNHVHLSMY
jgi:peptidoglycan DL-endopeptidase CwlO